MNCVARVAGPKMYDKPRRLERQERFLSPRPAVAQRSRETGRRREGPEAPHHTEGNQPVPEAPHHSEANQSVTDPFRSLRYGTYRALNMNPKESMKFFRTAGSRSFHS